MKRKTAILLVALLFGLGGTALGIAGAQQAASKAAGAQPAPCPCMEAGIPGSGQMGRMMGQGMMSMQASRRGMQPGTMGMGPMMVPGAKVEVKSIENGAVITITSAAPKPPGAFRSWRR